ncbi:MAG: phosphatase PAP2 family protein [Fibrella sp.]|nr:phosphatase PAP2 family protein [Armatimonadota bacterium]
MAATEVIRHQKRFARLATAQAWLRAQRGTIAVLFLLGIFVLLTVIAKSPGLRDWDADVSRFVQRGESAPLTAVARAFTILGNGSALFIVSIPAFAWLWRARKPVGGLLLVAAILGHVLNIGLKALVNRPRPNEADEVAKLFETNGSSFPSGHAMTAVMFFGFLAVLLEVHVRSRPSRRLLIGLTTFLALGICLSRVYLGNHFTSDIMGGIAAGLLFLFAWVMVYRRWGAKEFAPAVSNETSSDAQNAATI